MQSIEKYFWVLVDGRDHRKNEKLLQNLQKCMTDGYTTFSSTHPLPQTRLFLMKELRDSKGEKKKIPQFGDPKEFQNCDDSSSGDVERCTPTVNPIAPNSDILMKRKQRSTTSKSPSQQFFQHVHRPPPEP